MLPIDRGTRELFPLIDFDPQELADLLEWLRARAAASETEAEGRVLHAQAPDVPGAAPASLLVSAPFTIKPANPDGAKPQAEYDVRPSAFEDGSSDIDLTRMLYGGGPLAVRAGGQASGGHAGQARDQDAAKGDQANEDEPDVLVRQTVGIEQDVDVDIALKGDGDEVDVKIETNADIDQNADVDIAYGDLELDDGWNVATDLDDSLTIDQDAQVEVRGYGGKVVTRIRAEQSVVTDQDADVAIETDDDGKFAVRLNQNIWIEQDTDLDIDLVEEEGVLYVDLWMRDRIDADQNTAVEIDSESEGPVTVHVFQNAGIDQDVDIDIDIEDDLEDRYLIKIAVDVRRDMDIDQDADVGVVANGVNAEIAVDADQTIAIDQDLFVRIDFSLT